MTLVVLTGATRGIGQAAAVELAKRGADVAFGRTSRRPRPRERAQNEASARALWERSAELTGIAS